MSERQTPPLLPGEQKDLMVCGQEGCFKGSEFHVIWHTGDDSLACADHAIEVIRYYDPVSVHRRVSACIDERGRYDPVDDTCKFRDESGPSPWTGVEIREPELVPV